MSSNIVFDGNGGGRVWVVNQDNNSVSVFNAATNAKLAEIAVGAGPRTLAVAPNGTVWVTNKHAATISVIDPATMSVSQTLRVAVRLAALRHRVRAHRRIRLRRARSAAARCSSSTRPAARCSPASSVGRNPRHVSVNADGTLVYVSRFVTPPLPGESHGAGAAGGRRRRSGGGVRGHHDGVEHHHARATATSRTSRSRAAACRTTWAPSRCRPTASSAWVPSKQDNVAARHAAQRREPQLPEHGARDRLAHRPRHRR